MALRWQRPVQKVQEPLFREGQAYEGAPCRASHPVYGWGWFAVDESGINYEKPLRWIEAVPEDKEDSSGRWEWAKDVM